MITNQIQNPINAHTMKTSTPNHIISKYDMLVMPIFLSAINTPITTDGMPTPIVKPPLLALLLLSRLEIV
jgi:hypothetical protein